MFRLIVSIVMLIAGLVGPARAADGGPAIHRYAFIIGTNAGGDGRVPLRYATSDAQAMARILEELGGVAEGDRVILLEPRRSEFEAAADELRRRMTRERTAGRRVELVVYYSGHSDDTGLLLGDERIGYEEFRRTIDELPAEVRIAILDSCQSGALTRLKGGKQRPPFLLDRSGEVRGRAILTSSSENEAAQESDRLRASFFTHYLISGLRGAADTTADGRVTLTEAYQFAFTETLARTQKTQSGPQHAAYDIQLAGTGDVVMTDLRATSAGIILAEALSGRMFVRDADERLVAELYKARGRVVELGLPPGDYTVVHYEGGAVYEGAVHLEEGTRAPVSLAELQLVSIEEARARGIEPDGTETQRLTIEVPTDGGYVHVVASMSLMPGVSTDGILGDYKLIKNLSFNWAYGRAARLEGLEIGIGVNHVEESVRGAQLGSGANIAGGSVLGGQAGAIFNYAGERMVGFQGTGLANYAGASVIGMQAAGVFNYAGERVVGFQGAGLFNHAGGSMIGVQAGPVNLAGDTRGAQLAVVNISGDVSGAQVGVVNIAKHVKGTQIGLFNISDEIDGVPIGLVSYARKGGVDLELSTTTSEPLNVGLRFSSRYAYSLLAAGTLRLDGDGLEPDDAYVGIGFGVRVPLSQFHVELDFLGADPYVRFSETDDESEMLLRGRLSVAWQLAERFGIFAGLTYNAFFGFEGDDNRHVASGARDWEIVERSGDTTFRRWPALHAGVRIF